MRVAGESEHLEPTPRARARESRPATTPPAERVLLCTLHESVTGNGVPRLRGRAGHAVLVGWLDRDAAPSPRRWQLFAYTGGEASQDDTEARVYMMSLIEKMSARGVRRLCGRLGPMRVTAFLAHGSDRCWQVYLTRFEPWTGRRATAAPETCENRDEGD